MAAPAALAYEVGCERKKKEGKGRVVMIGGRELYQLVSLYDQGRE
jgi:hypothetical protein